MNKKNKRIFSLALCALLVFQVFVLPLAAFAGVGDGVGLPSLSLSGNGNYTAGGPDINQYQRGYTADELGVYEPNDDVNAIVMLPGKSILERATEKGLTAKEYLKTDEGKAALLSMNKEQNRVIAELGSDISDIEYRYTTLFSGFACTTKYKTLAEIEKTFEGSSALVSERYEPEAEATDNALNAYKTGIYNSSKAGYTGKGMVVAILDTGLDYNHTAFQKLPDGKVTLTADDIEEIFPYLEAAKLDNTARWEECYYSDKVVYMFDYADKDSDVYPINDHGTHVAGIIAGNDDSITGVAVDAQLVIMKVFGNKDAGAEQEDLLAALSDAILLGVDVINMSLGSSCGFSRASDEDATNAVYDQVRAAGINLVVAASNSHSSAKGSNVGDTNRTSNPDSMTLGSPATYDSSLAVASVLGAKSNYLLANGVEPIYLIKAKNNLGDDIEFYDLLLNGQQSAEFEYVLVPGIGNDGNYANVDVKGKIAIVKRGVSTFEEKVETAAAHGAIGCIIYNNVSGTISMTIGTATLPTCSISMDSGVYFTENTTGKIVLSAGNLAGPFMSDFSSWGPNGDLTLNPDLTSYGGDIYSAVRGGYDTLSGTSMACPNLAGSASLVRQYVREKFPTLNKDEVTTLVNRLLMSTCSILFNEAGNPYSPRKQGAGLADAERAIKTGAYLSVDGSDKVKLSLGDDAAKKGVYTLTFRLNNISNSTKSYRLNTFVMTETVSSDGKTVAEQAYMLNSKITYTVEGGNLNGDVVTVGGYRNCKITATVTLSDEDRTYLDKNFANGMYAEGFVTLASNDGDANLTIPYLAFYGDWTKAPMLDVTAFEEGKEAKDSSILEDEKLKADVYATIPMVGFYSGNELTYYYMCKPAFNLADGYEAPATLEEYCALTTSTEGNFQIKYISAGLLRNAKTVDMTIKDAVTGEVIFTKTAQNCRKSSYSGSQTGGYVLVEFDASTAKLSNNRKYVFDMTCHLEWDGEQHNLKNAYSFSFYIDDEAPVLDLEKTQLRVEKDTAGNIVRYLLDLQVYDNRYVSGFFVSTYDELDAQGNPIEPEYVINGFVPVDDQVAGTTNKITFDLTSVWHKLKDGDTPGSKNIQFTLYDYAKNETEVHFTLDKSSADTVNFKNGRKNTANGDEISFTLAPYKQLNLLSTSYLVTTPTDVYTEELIFTSSNPDVATVDAFGVVTAWKNGEAVITATSPTTGAKASVKINCTGKGKTDTIPVSGLTLNASWLSLVRGETYDFYVTVNPSNASTMPKLTWTSSSPYVTLTVDPDNPLHCIAFAEKTGSAQISVKADGTLFSASCNVSIAEEFTITGSLLTKYNGRGDKNGVVTIPDDKGITYINRLAFYNNDYITKVIIPEGVEEIQYAAFYGCENLREVVLPSTCKKIDEWGFGYDENLEKINLGHVESICQLAFYNNNSLKEVDLSSCHTICDRAFSFCRSLTTLDISNVGQIGDYSFVYCTSLEELRTSKINKIADYAFTGCSSLRSLELYATYIGKFAFYSCSALTDVVFMSDVTEIDESAFYNATALSNLSFRGTCKYIDDFAFANCSALTAIFIPAGCEYLGTYAFGAARSATSVTFSADANIRSVGANPFYLLPYVSEFTLEPGSKYLTVRDGILYDKNMTKLLLVPFFRQVGYLSVPETVTAIGDYAFSTVYAVGTVRLNNVTKIGDGAFMDSNVEMIVSNDKVRTVGENAFRNCAKLTAFALTDTLESIGDYAFATSAVPFGNLTIPASVKTIGAYAFAGNENITSVTVPAQIRKIGEGAFSECAMLSSVTLPDGLAEIGSYAFLGASRLTSLTLPDSVKTLGEGVFAGCSALATVRLSAGMTSIPDYTFLHAEALTSLTLPDGITEIGDYAFYGADSFATMNFNKVNSVGKYSFVGTKMTAISAPELVTVSDFAFSGIAAETITLPKAETIGAGAFYLAEKLTSVNLPAARTIGDGAFFHNVKLSDVRIPACETLGNSVFYQDVALSSLSLDKIVSIGSFAFYNTAITSLALPASLKEVAPNAFTTKAFNSTDASLVRMENITLDKDNKTFFLDEKGVLYSYLPDGSYVLVAYLSGKTDTSYTVLDGTYRIADYAFSTNLSLQNVKIARTVKYIGTGAFYGCTALSSIEFLSVNAPTLESRYSSASADGWTYNNFVDTIGEVGSPRDIEVTVPANAVGYDSFLWARYIGLTKSSGVIGMTDSTAALIRYIDELPSKITLADAETVDYLQKVYTATDKDQRTFVTNYAKLKAAIETIAKLRASAGTVSVTDPKDLAGLPEQDLTPAASRSAFPTVPVIIVSVVVAAALIATLCVLHLKKKKGDGNNEE